MITSTKLLSSKSAMFLRARPAQGIRLNTHFSTRLNAWSSPRVRFNSSVTEVADLAHFNKVIDNTKKLSVVDFYATWCGPCKAIAPIFEALAVKIPEVEFARVDVDRAEDVAREYAISAMPTILFFQEGQKVDTIVGANVPKLLHTIKEYSGVDAKER